MQEDLQVESVNPIIQVVLVLVLSVVFCLAAIVVIFFTLLFETFKKCFVIFKSKAGLVKKICRSLSCKSWKVPHGHA